MKIDQIFYFKNCLDILKNLIFRFFFIVLYTERLKEVLDMKYLEIFNWSLKEGFFIFFTLLIFCIVVYFIAFGIVLLHDFIVNKIKNKKKGKK